jgi:Flp pilus assembly protein TadG
MAAKRVCEKLRRTWRMVHGARGGNVTLTFALALVPTLGLVGAAVDYSRANSARTQMQAALDSTALMLSKEASSLTSTQMTQKASDYFNAMFTRPEALNKQLSVNYSASGSSLTLSASAIVNSSVLQVIGFNQIPINTSSTVKWGVTRLRVALVLDNTGSMNETDATGTSKISALKTASHQFLTMMQNAAATAGDIQVAIVPFTTFVKVDPALYKDSSWIDWSYNGSGGGGDDRDSIGSGCDGGDDDNHPCNPNKNNWNGCFTDRTQPYDVQNTAPSAANRNTYFPAVNCSITQLQSLSYNWTTLNSKIDQMVAAGYTNQTIGLAWGWQALTAGDPLNAPTPPPSTQQIVILLTDGLNTKNRWTTNQSSIDARTLAACTNIKAAGIQIYTVLVMSGDSSILQQCASKSSMYFALSSSSQIITTFNQIGTNLAQLRIAR